MTEMKKSEKITDSIKQLCFSGKRKQNLGLFAIFFLHLCSIRGLFGSCIVNTQNSGLSMTRGSPAQNATVKEDVH